MVGGTSFPPHDSESEPWSNEQKAKATPKPSTKGKSKPEAALPERSRLATRSLEVSLDNADRVIEGALSFSRTLRKGWDHRSRVTSGVSEKSQRETTVESRTSRKRRGAPTEPREDQRVGTDWVRR